MVDQNAAGTAAAFLSVTGPGGQATRVRLGAGSAVLGRSAECSVHLDHVMVSRQHARLDPLPDGRWRVTDLGSHNGTRVNGVAVGTAVLGHGDQVDVGPFQVRLDAPAATPPTAAADPGMTMAGGGGGRGASAAERLAVTDDVRVIRTLREVQPPRLAVEQLRCLEAYGPAALAIPDPADRLVALCRLVVDPCFGGRWAVVVSPALGSGGVTDTAIDPRPLCPVQRPKSAEAAAEPPRLSRSLLRAARDRNEPVIATNRPGGGSGVGSSIEMSIAAEVVSMAAVAVPLGAGKGEAGKADPAGGLLYVTFPPEYGTGEWLALCALAGRHYRQAEAVWENIEQARRLATLEADLERARRVQDRLVPKRCDLPGLDVAIRFRPCHGVAGDYVDAVPLPDGRALLVVADVSGKGLGAAMVAMGLHTMVHTAARRWTGLADLAAGLDAHLTDSLPPEAFVTFFAVVLDHATGAMEVVNGGHPPATAVDRDGRVRPIGTTAGFPLGMLPQTLEVTADELRPGETTVLFTDGCYEVFDAADRMLGPDEFARLAAEPIASSATVAAAADGVTKLLDDWQGSGEPGDDRTLLMVRRRT